MKKFSLAKVSLYGMFAVALSVIFRPDIAFLIIMFASFLHDICGVLRNYYLIDKFKPEWVDFLHAFLGCFFGTGYIFAERGDLFIMKIILFIVFSLMLILEKLGWR